MIFITILLVVVIFYEVNFMEWQFGCDVSVRFLMYLFISDFYPNVCCNLICCVMNVLGITKHCLCIYIETWQ